MMGKDNFKDNYENSVCTEVELTSVWIIASSVS